MSPNETISSAGLFVGHGHCPKCGKPTEQIIPVLRVLEMERTDWDNEEMWACERCVPQSPRGLYDKLTHYVDRGRKTPRRGGAA